MAKSDNLRKAKEQKNDEFYTRLEDIEAEISQHDDYVRQFQGKTVFCNCDDPEWSNFFLFFKLHFKQLGLKKLITTHYNADGSPSYKIEWCGEMLNDDMVNLIKTPLKGNGDFQSEECVEILKEADVVVTNPPYSLYRKYIETLIEYDKKFVIIGNPNSIAYKEVFPLLKDGKMFIGYKSPSGGMWFHVKEETENEIKSGKIKTTWKYINGKLSVNCPGIWFTNFDLDKSHEPLILTKNYKGNESRYPKYDNYDAIECGKVKDIPKDYFPCWYKCSHAGSCIYAQTEGKEDKALCEMARNGEIGVPITYLAQHCGDQFEILGSDNDFAEKMENIDPNGIYTKGGPAFYLKDRNDDLTQISNELPFVRSDQIRSDQIRSDQIRSDQIRSQSLQASIQQAYHSQTAISATESSASRSRSSQNSAQSSSGLSVQQWDGRQEQNLRNGSVLSDTTTPLNQLPAQEVMQSQTADSCTIGSLFRDCRKCNGVLGVPITYLASHCSEQFEILESCDRGESPYKTKIYSITECQNWSDANRGASLYENGRYKNMYHRLLIQRKPEKE